MKASGLVHNLGNFFTFVVLYMELKRFFLGCECV
jgi:hypothetical protein